jgi:PKD repeat protein
MVVRSENTAYCPNGWTIISNTATPGSVRVLGFANTPTSALVGNHSLFGLNCEALTDDGSSTELNLTIREVYEYGANAFSEYDAVNGLFQTWDEDEIQPPVAGFVANVTIGHGPMAVQFTDHSTNAPESWFWTFGDDSTSTLRNPLHIYTTPSTYAVSLTATNAAGNNTHTKSNYITVTEQQQDPNWLVTLNITSGTFYQELTMGVHEAATRRYDANMDIPYPPDPPGAQKSAFFAINDTLFPALSADYKPTVSDTNPTEIWVLKLTSNETIKVTWDTSGFTIPEIQLTWKNGSATEPMRILSGTTLSSGTYSVIITASTGNEMEIPIATGWNLISVPYTNAEYTLPSPNPIQIIYWYNPTTRMYEVTPMNALVPGRAYWIASTSTFQIGVKGMPASPITTDLSTGWNLVGGTDQDITFGSIAIDPAGAWAMPFVYGYNTDTRTYEQATVLTPGAGYWGAVTADSTITIPGIGE